MKLNSPCKKCKDRVSHCHNKCEKYQNYVTKNNELKLIKAKQNALTCQIYDCETRVMRKLGIRK